MRQAGNRIGVGLVGRQVEDQPVDALAKVPVAHGLKQKRMVPPATTRRERLGPDDGLSVHVGCRRHRPAGIPASAGRQGRELVLSTSPEFADGHVAGPRVGDVVDAQHPVSLYRKPHAVRSDEFPQPGGVVVANHLPDGGANVPQETVGERGAAHDVACHGGQPGTDVVTAPRAELLRKGCRPVLVARLPTVDVRKRQRPADSGIGVLDDLLEERVKVGFNARLAQPVALQANRRLRAGTGHLKVRRLPDAEHQPPPGWDVPFQPPLAVHVVGQV